MGVSLSKCAQDCRKALAAGELTSLDAQPKAAAVLRHIGSNAVPCLIEWIGYETPPWKEALLSGVAGLPDLFGAASSLRAALAKAELRAEFAAIALRTLGPEARRAIPALSRLAHEERRPRASVRAICALAELGQEALPALLSALEDHQNSQWLHALLAIQRLRAQGVEIDAAVPVLTNCLSANAAEVRAAAAWVLGSLAPYKLRAQRPPAEPAPVRDSGLHPESQSVGWGLVAVPALLKALDDSDFSVRAAATNSLRAIRPQMLDSAGL